LCYQNDHRPAEINTTLAYVRKQGPSRDIGVKWRPWSAYDCSESTM